MVELTQLDQLRVTKLETMKKMKQTIYGLVLVLLIAGSSYGQAIDQKRMERDLKIAKNILETLSNNDENRLGFFGHQTEGSYIPNFGVILSFPSNTSFNIHKSKINLIAYPSLEGNTVAPPAPPGGKTKSHTYSYVYSTDSDDDCDNCPDKEEIKEEIKEKIKQGQEEWAVESEETFKEQATAFLVDYANLIGQLKPTDKIMITTKSKNSHVFFLESNMVNRLKNKQSTARSAEILKSDLIAYKQGKASREATIKKIKFSTSTKDVKLERDLELFGSIFAKLYDSDLSTTYYTSSHRVSYERLENFGAIYNMRVYSSSQDNGFHTIRTTRERGLTQEERNKKVNAMYPEFEQSVKENILDYGRTIKSLKSNEILMFKIRLTECNGCEMPRSIEVSIKASVLSDYGSGKLSRDKAIGAITVKKTSN